MEPDATPKPKDPPEGVNVNPRHDDPAVPIYEQGPAFYPANHQDRRPWSWFWPWR